MQFFWFAPDFKRAESFDFMDDDFYYYVRVVPKERAYRRRFERAEEAAGSPGNVPADGADLLRDAEAGFGEQPAESAAQSFEEVSL